MSRIGKAPIEFNNDIQVNLLGNVLTVKGPKGQLTQAIHQDVGLEIKDGVITVKPKNDSTEANALWGLFRSLISNMVHGVKDGYTIELEINGTGYKASVQNSFLVLSLGHSHDIFVEIDDDLEVVVKKNVISISGVSKQKVGQFAAEIRSFRKPEPYKGKGVKYADEVILRKEGKKK